MIPILVARMQRILDQQPAKPRAIDEQIGLDALTAVERQRLDEPVLGP